MKVEHIDMMMQMNDAEVQPVAVLGYLGLA